MFAGTRQSGFAAKDSATEVKSFSQARLQVQNTRLRCGMDTRERISEIVENPEQVEELAEAVQEEGKKWLDAADEFIRQNPYLALGIALAAGCAIATLLRNRD
jgi:ElaB/YqjD/DUF883 family membrane-anchored ribosome-binding protein